MEATSAARTDKTIAHTAMQRVTFRSITSSCLLFLSLTAFSVAWLSYAENKGHFLPLSFLNAAVSISAVFLMSSKPASQFPWKHLTERKRGFNFCSNLRKPSRFRYSSGSGPISGPSRPTKPRLRKWQLRQPFLSRICSLLRNTRGKSRDCFSEFGRIA